MSSPLSIRGLIHLIPHTQNILFKIPELDVLSGEKLLIAGPSGSGKSTLIKLITGEHAASQGEILKEGSIAIVYQDLNLIEALSALENAEVELTEPEQLEYFSKLVTQFGMKEKLNKIVRQLSFGERQVIAVCRALASGASLIVADEPTSHLDHQKADLVMKLLTELTQASLIISHDQRFFPLFKRVVHFEEFRA